MKARHFLQRAGTRLVALASLAGAVAGWGTIIQAADPNDGSRAPSQDSRPNVILCMADDLGWGDAGFNGSSIAQTPNLDRMARAGLIFDRFYSAAPVCSPTRASVLTGRHPYRMGIFSANVGHLPARESTLSELLRENGYRTGHFGKWHLGTLTRTERDSNRGGRESGEGHYAPPWERGFDVCFSTEAKTPTFDPMWKPADARPGGPWWTPIENLDQAVPYGTAYWNEKGERVTEALRGDDSGLIMDRALRFITEAAGEDRPFFAVIWFHAPHLPVVAGEGQTGAFQELDEYARHYFGSIAGLDAAMGRLWRALEDLGIQENAMVWFCSDNGPEGQSGTAPGSAGPFRGRKRDLFEGGVRVPGFLLWPNGVAGGRRTQVAASTSDYFPTILESLGIALPSGWKGDGVSLRPLFHGEMERSREIGFESGRRAAWVGGRYKLLREVRRGEPGIRGLAPEDQLYDLWEDPGETTNLASEMPERAARMAGALEDWRKECQQDRARLETSGSTR